jgi:hypothetical protein
MTERPRPFIARSGSKDAADQAARQGLKPPDLIEDLGCNFGIGGPSYLSPPQAVTTSQIQQEPCRILQHVLHPHE